MPSFDAEYKKLNDAQRQAVDAIDGPVLVIAGPGTGKTQLLALRVANILKSTDTDASAVLGLTFTNKAALNMRERLISLIGPTGSRVNVKTFHSFAAEIMNMYPDYFWNGAKLTIVPDAVATMIIDDTLAKLPLDNPLALKFAGQFTLIQDVKNGLQMTKEAGLTPSKLKAILDYNLALIENIEHQMIDICSTKLSVKSLDQLVDKVTTLPGQEIDQNVQPLMSLSTLISDSLEIAASKDKQLGKTTNTSKWKSRWIQIVNGQKGMFNERSRNAWWLALATVYETYRNQLHERGFYDYGDMLVEVLDKLENNPEILADIQERFNYVLIDEFQDTNAAQFRLAHLVADHYSSSTTPNIMAVGDDDQAIYRFNGAELDNMIAFIRDYPATQLFVLTDNYRSGQTILNASSRVIKNAEDRLINRLPQVNKSLNAQQKSKDQVIHNLYLTRQHQLNDITTQIKSLHVNKALSIAVLARNHHSLRQLAGHLTNSDVAINYEQQNNILDHPAIKQLNYIAELIVNIAGGDTHGVNVVLSKTLRHPMWNIKPEILWQLASNNYQGGSWLDAMLASKDKSLKLIAQWLVWLSAEAGVMSLPLTMEHIVGLRPGPNFTGPIKDYFIDSNKFGTSYLQTLSALRLLREFIVEFSSSVAPTIQDFVSFIRLNSNNEQLITDQTVFVSRPNAVQLMTVHKAKGLEFDHVFIIDAIDKNWSPRTQGRKPPANLPLQKPGDIIDDYARLLYVAMTRAKTNLNISSYKYDDNNEEIMASLLLSGLNFKDLTDKHNDNEQLIAVLEQDLRWPLLSADSQTAMLQSRMQTYSLSATGLLNYLNIMRGGPQHFLEHNILRLPEIKTASLAHGTAVHDALEYAQLLTNGSQFNLGKVLEKYQQSLHLQYLPSQEYERYLIHGRAVLTRLFKKFRYGLTAGSLPEQKIASIKFGAANLSGKLDRLDITSNQLTIVDYKTGKPIINLNVKNEKAWKHKTQLIFYALLVRHSPRFVKYKKVDSQIVYIEAENSKDLIVAYSVSDQDIIRLEKLIAVVWKKIANLEFVDTSHYPATAAGIMTFEEDLLTGKI